MKAAIETGPHKPLVAGSIPAAATSKHKQPLSDQELHSSPQTGTSRAVTFEDRLKSCKQEGWTSLPTLASRPIGFMRFAADSHQETRWLFGLQFNQLCLGETLLEPLRVVAIVNGIGDWREEIIMVHWDHRLGPQGLRHYAGVR